MTTIFFVRHAEADNSNSDTRNRNLTEKGLLDIQLVTEFLSSKNISAIYSSPYKRAIDTVSEFASLNHLTINTIEDFRERKSSGIRLSGNEEKEFFKQLFEDFDFALPGEENLNEVQRRNISALVPLLEEHMGKNIVVATHGIALATIIRYFDSSFSFLDFWDMLKKLPWIVKVDFNKDGCIGMVMYNLFKPFQPINQKDWITKVSDLGSLKAYRFVVIFSRYNGKWVYCRGKTRNCYETAGGHIEEGETTLEAARRELFEETGATSFDIIPVSDYSVHIPTEWSNGQVFLANIHTFGEMPSYEMAEIICHDRYPESLRFPSILPVLFDEIQKYL